MININCHNFILGPVDTDSISFCKPDQTIFSKEEQQYLLDEINNLLPKMIRYEHDGYFKKVIICAGKNYVLQTEDDKVKIKGSALKATTKSPAMKEMIKRIIQSLLDGKTNQQDIYLEYIKEAAQVKDIKRWAVRKTISDKTLTNERTNESKIRDAIVGTEIAEGDRIYVYTTPEDTLKLVEQFDGNYHVAKLVKNVYDTIWTFESVLDCDSFINYSLKKNKGKLEELLK